MEEGREEGVAAPDREGISSPTSWRPPFPRESGRDVTGTPHPCRSVSSWSGESRPQSSPRTSRCAKSQRKRETETDMHRMTVSPDCLPPILLTAVLLATAFGGGQGQIPKGAASSGCSSPEAADRMVAEGKVSTHLSPSLPPSFSPSLLRSLAPTCPPSFPPAFPPELLRARQTPTRI